MNRDFIRANYTKFEYRIPMRDGVKLFASVYIPKDVFTDPRKIPHIDGAPLQRPAIRDRLAGQESPGYLQRQKKTRTRAFPITFISVSFFGRFS